MGSTPILTTNMVSWPSGLRHLPAKEEFGLNPGPGFESLAHRQRILGMKVELNQVKEAVLEVLQKLQDGDYEEVNL